MRVQYHIDSEKFSLGWFKESLRSREMIPSRVGLRDDLDEHFRIIEHSGITNHKELIGALRTRPKIEEYSRETGLSVEYLTLLVREARSYLPRPIALDRFAGIASQYVEKLEALGIKNSRHLFNAAKELADRERMARVAGVPIAILNELIGLSDLSRAYGVGPVFARLLYDVGVKSIRDLVRHTAEDIVRIYEQRSHKKTDFSVDEIRFSLKLARELDIAVET